MVEPVGPAGPDAVAHAENPPVRVLTRRWKNLVFASPSLRLVSFAHCFLRALSITARLTTLLLSFVRRSLSSSERVRTSWAWSSRRITSRAACRWIFALENRPLLHSDMRSLFFVTNLVTTMSFLKIVWAWMPLFCRILHDPLKCWPVVHPNPKIVELIVACEHLFI